MDSLNTALIDIARSAGERDLDATASPELRTAIATLFLPVEFETGCKNLRNNLKAIDKLIPELRKAQERRDEEIIERDRRECLQITSNQK